MLAILKVDKQTRLGCIRQNPFAEQADEPESLWLFAGTLDSTIQYSLLQAVCLLSNGTG